MKFAALIVLALPAVAQIANRTSPAVANMPPSAGGAPILTQQRSAKIPLATLVTLERGFDAKFAGIAADANGPVDLLGATRGLYLDGYGVVFTAELSLVQTPTLNTFNNYRISDEQKVRVHSTKVSRLAALRKAVLEMAQTAAASLPQVAENQQVVLAVRLDYATWENTAGLPGLITAKADRRSAMAGNIQLEEQ
jgi:hypothetical protein